VLALALAINAPAQPVPPPNTNTYTGGTNTVDWAAIAAAQQADYSNNYAPWVVADLSLQGQLPLTTDALQAQTTANLLTLSTNIAIGQVQQQTIVSNLLVGQPIQIPQSWIANGVSYYFDHTNADGSASIKATFNIESAETVGAQKLWPGGTSGYSLNGSNVLLAQWDGGDVLTNHQEFANGQRVYLLDGPSAEGVQDHPTHVAGTMVAYGVNGTSIGFANRARLAESYFNFDLSEMPSVAATNNIRESNHSYGIEAGWAGYVNVSGTLYWLWVGNPAISSTTSWIFGFYDTTAQTDDEIVYTAQTYLPVFAAGNANGEGQHGPDSQPTLHVEYINGTYYYSTASRNLNDWDNGYDTLSSYSVTKNNLVVGAVNPNTNGYTGPNTTTNAYFTSQGPTADGRIKPDVVADGVNVFSTLSTNTTSYGYDSGTSMATPAVTGTAGLLTSFYQQLYSTNAPLLSGTNTPLSSTLRGLLIHTADQLGAYPGPSYIYGWGLIDPVAAVTLITNNYAAGSVPFIKEVRLVSGDYVQFPVVLTNGQPFKATITWTDPPGTPVAPALNPTNHMLVNDLDLRVISPGGTTNYPWVLNPSSPSAAATTGDNNLDNVEQVSLTNPTSGTYTVRITHKGNLVNDQGQTAFQNVSIIMSGNVVQPPTIPQITAISALTVSNIAAIKWSTDVGRVYKVQSRSDLASGSWSDTSGELSATKTNTADTFYIGGTSQQFYRVVQVR
jgi:hypothetical protein